MNDKQAGKGDKYRKVDPKKWDEGWERSFGNYRKPNPKIMKPKGIIDMSDVPEKIEEKDK